MDDFWQYFPNYDTWIPKTNIPYRLSATTPFSINNNGYFITGYSILQTGYYLKTNFEYSPDTLGYTGTTQIYNKEAKGIFIYPNPCTDKLVVICDKLLLSKVEITDMLGGLVIQQLNNSINQPFQVDVSTLSNGIYFIRIIGTDNLFASQKFIKQ